MNAFGCTAYKEVDIGLEDDAKKLNLGKVLDYNQSKGKIIPSF